MLMGIFIDRFMVVVFFLRRIVLSYKVWYVFVFIWIILIVICLFFFYVNKMEEYEGEFYCYEEWVLLLELEMVGCYYIFI